MTEYYIILDSWDTWYINKPIYYSYICKKLVKKYLVIILL